MTPEIIKTPKEIDAPFAGYVVKYKKVNFDEPVDVSELQEIETKALSGDGSVIMVSQEKFSFQTSYFYVVKYLVKQ